MDNNQQKDYEHYRARVKTNFIYPGMILQGDGFTTLGKKIISAGEPFTQEQINYLIKHHIEEIYYDKPIIFTGRTTQPIISYELIGEAIDLMENLKISANGKIKFPEKDIIKVVDQFIDSISNAPVDAVLDLLEIKNHDDRLYSHSINTSVIAIAFAIKEGYTKEGIKAIGTGALLHDIGLLSVDPKIIYKDTTLTHEEKKIIEESAIIGYKILKSQSQFGPLIEKIVLLNHERYDGKGYPLKVRGEQLGNLAPLVTIAANFEELTEQRKIRGKTISQWYALNLMSRNSGTWFHPGLLNNFIEKMPSILTEGEEFFKENEYVELNTGEIAEVINISSPYSLYPTIKILLDEKKEKLLRSFEINLANQKERFISDIISDMDAKNEIQSILSGSSREAAEQLLKGFNHENSQFSKDINTFEKNSVSDFTTDKNYLNENILDIDESNLS